MNARQLKPKACRECKTEFIPRTSLQRVCQIDCAIAESRKKQEKRQKAKQAAQRKSDRKRKEALKTTSDWARECQSAVNAYIRARDYGKPCISCNRPPGEMGHYSGHHTTDAGHYRSRGAASHLRFNLLNIHGQCVQCNRSKSGNAVEYRINLINRIGLHNVNRLECSHTPRKFSIDYLRRLKRLMNKRARYYRRRRGLE